MFESFLNPWTMAAGALLVSAPIIIHLINRMRYRRIEWAAMEFLLKAQKRLKRKVIIEQFLLLLMRCLLVALLGVLLGRYMGCNPIVGQETRSTFHLVILDDTPSMTDGWKTEAGSPTDAFKEAKRVLLEQIVPAAAQASTPQSFEVIRLSDQSQIATGAANAQIIKEFTDKLNALEPVSMRVPLDVGLQKAKAMLAEKGGKDIAKVIHVLSDFRSSDWTTDGQRVRDVVAELNDQGVKVYFVDTANPVRKDDKRPPLFHDNIGVVELRPAKLTVARYEPVDVLLRVRNYGTSELKDVQFSIRVNGDENKGGRRVSFSTLAPGVDQTEVVSITLDRVGTAEKPLERYNLISAVMESTEPGGIAADNVRHAVVEVRERLPILVIDGQPSLRDKKEGDGFYLKTVFANVLQGFTWQYGVPTDLETKDLRNFATILMLNVPGVSEAGAKNLENYVREGGGVGFFLGPTIRPNEYNTRLYNDGNGVFPFPLPERPTEPLADDVLLLRRFNFQKKIMRRDKDTREHPALFGLYHDERGQANKDEEELEKYFRFVVVNQYWSVKRLGKWRDDKSVKELYCLPNESPMSAYDGAAQAIANGLPVDDAKFAKYKEILDKAKRDINVTRNSAEPLYKLANLLDKILADQRNEGDPEEALYREFWAQPDVKDLKANVIRLRDNVKYGDPLYIAKEFGKGRVTVMTTTAGEQWTDWASSQPGNVSFTPVIKEMGTYLASGGTESNLLLGEPVRIGVDATKYKGTATKAFITHNAKTTAGDLAPFKDLGEVVMTTEKDQFTTMVNQTEPGVTILTLMKLRTQAVAGEPAEVPEYRAFAFNVDTPKEGDLRRAAKDDIIAPTAASADASKEQSVGLYTSADKGWLESLKNKRRDLSELSVLFLVLLLLLIAEQAMAVRLSYHGKDEAVAKAAPSAAAAFQRTNKASLSNATNEPATVG